MLTSLIDYGLLVFNRIVLLLLEVAAGVDHLYFKRDFTLLWAQDLLAVEVK